MTAAAPTVGSLRLMLRSLKLPGFAAHVEEVSETATREGWTFLAFLHELASLELQDRRRRRIERNLKASNLPSTKTLATLELKRLPAQVRTQVSALCNGDFLRRGANVLAFGLPGRGKSHTLTAIGHELVQRGHRVLFVPTFQLVQKLLAAKRDLLLEAELKRLDRFDAVVLDDIGYVQQDRAEMEVLFTFLADRYERRSVMISSNLVFSQWDRIFKDAMTTAAAIDRVVHHCVILEMTGPSFRAEVAEKNLKGGAT
ncbi:MAG: IS21-like element helper ATPase IstB [Chloroflexi bacterium]|nr:IS21-like element helper ATPase IstB [Chloroflexota bacterium]